MHHATLPSSPHKQNKDGPQVRFSAHGFPHLLSLGTHLLTIYALYHLVYANYDYIAFAVNEVRGRVGNVYTSIRSGTYRVECAVGAAPIQMAECQIIQGINLILIQIVTQLAEFVYSIAQMKNVFGCAALVLGFMHPIGRVLSPRRLVQPLGVLCRWQSAYYGMLHNQYSILCDGTMLLVTSLVHSTRNVGKHHPREAHPIRNEKRLRFPRSCPGKVERVATRSMHAIGE